MSQASPADATGSLLEQRLVAIERELTEAAGGASLCAISRSAGSVPAAKYLEGRMAAIRELRRALAAGRSFAEVVDERRDAWRSAFEQAVERSMGPDWHAYRAGGVDELDSLAAAASTDPKV